MKKLRKYKKQMPHSYTLGPFPTFEALENRPEMIERVVYSDDFNEKEKLIHRLEELQIPYSEEPRTLERISGQKNIYLAGVVKKRRKALEKERNHLLLENIRDMGNLGNICRSALAFNCKNIGLIGHCCDDFHPKVIRASMGAFFQINIEVFENLEEYVGKYPRQIYGFSLNKNSVELEKFQPQSPFALAFGNEGEGLSPDFFEKDSVFIEQNDKVDSLNLHTAVGITLYRLRKEFL